MTEKKRTLAFGALRPGRRSLRLGCLVGLVALAGFALREGLHAYVESVALEELRAMGFGAAELSVREIGWGRVVLADARLDHDLRVDEIVLAFAPDELLDGHLRRVVLRGARWDVALDADAIAASPLVRLARSGSSGRPAPDRLSVVEGRVRLHGERGSVRRLDLRGDVDPKRSHASFEVRSPLGRHRVRAWTREEGLDTRIELRARALGSPDELAFTAVVPREEEAPVRIHARGRLDAIERPGDPAVSAAAVLLEGDARVRSGRIEALAGRAVSVHASLGPVAVERLEVDLRSDGRVVEWTARGDAGPGLRMTVAGKLPAELERLATLPEIPASWTVEGEPSAALASAGVELAGATASASGDAWLDPEGGSLRVGAARLRATAERLDGPSLRARGIDATVSAEGGFDATGWHVELDEGSVATAAAVDARDLAARHLSLGGALRIESSDAGPRVSRGDLRARARRLALGQGDERIRAREVRARLRPRGDRPLLAQVDDAPALAFRLDARARSFDGALAGRALRLRGPVTIALADRPRVSARAEVRLGQVSHPDSGLSLTGVRVALRTRRSGGVTAGRLRAEGLSYDDHPLCAPEGSLRVGASSRLELACPDSPAGPATLAIEVGSGLPDGGSVRVRVPTAERGARDPFAGLLAELTDLEVRGRAGGELQVPVAAPGRARARLVIDGARVRSKGGEVDAQEVHGTLAFERLAPLRSAAPDALRWSRLTLGGVEVGGAGSARLRVLETGALAVRDMRFELAGGRVAVAPFRFHAERPDVALQLDMRGVDVGRALRTLTEGRADGSGRLDGHVAVRVRHEAPYRIVLGATHLEARGPGHVQMGGEELLGSLGEWARPLDGDLIARRVVAALADFAYTDFTLDRAPPARAPLRAHLVGTGRTVPQGVDLEVNLRGLQELLDEMFRLTTNPTENTDS